MKKYTQYDDLYLENIDNDLRVTESELKRIRKTR